MESSYPVRRPMLNTYAVSSCRNTSAPNAVLPPFQRVIFWTLMAAWYRAKFLVLQLHAQRSCRNFQGIGSAKAGRARTTPKPVHKAWRSLGSGGGACAVELRRERLTRLTSPGIRRWELIGVLIQVSAPLGIRGTRTRECQSAPDGVPGLTPDRFATIRTGAGAVEAAVAGSVDLLIGACGNPAV
jgi:hypothetical protein